MLSIAKITPAHASSYYSQDNYYSKESGLEQSAWFGGLAKDMGLSGQVDTASFASLVAGLDPKTGMDLVNRAGMHSGKMRAGIDLTFSAPKSVSLCALNDSRVSIAHRAAVDASLKVLEQEFAFVRRGKDRHLVKSLGLAVAKFHHDTARQVSRTQIPDPQLHTHCVILNIAKAEGGKVLSIFNDAFYDHSKLIGLIYQNELAKELKSLGYQLRTTKHQTIEIEGYSESDLQEFSKRRRQILAQGATNQKEARVAVLNGRVSKGEEIRRSSLKEQWLTRCDELRIRHPAPKMTPALTSKVQASEAAAAGVRHLAERDVAFSEKAIMEFGLAENLGKITSYRELRASSRQIESLLPYETNRYGHQSYTTLGALKQEMQMLALLRSSMGSTEPLLSDAAWARHLELSAKMYTDGQRQALEKTLTTKDPFIAWQGVAGAGKSYALDDLRAIAVDKGLRVIGMAPDAEGAKVLGESASLPESMTVASFLLKHQSTENEIWIVDEAGKLNTKDMLQLMERASKQKARVVFVGDTRQLAAVEAGNPFRALQKHGIETAHLTEHRRQKSLDLKRAVEKISGGDIKSAMKNLANSCKFEANENKRTRQIIKEYLSLSTEKRASTLVLCGTNLERQAITEGIRDGLKKTGELGQETAIPIFKQKDLTKEQARFMNHYETGDTICFRENKHGLRAGGSYSVIEVEHRSLILRDEKGRDHKFDPRSDIQRSVFKTQQLNLAPGDLVKWTKNEGARRNGQTLKVQSIEGGQVFLVNEKSKRVAISREEKQFLDHAYVHTVFSSQGKTCDNVIASIDQTYNRKALYVAISRAKSSVSLYAKDHDSVVSLEAKKAEKLNAMDLVPVAETSLKKGREVKMSL